MDQNPGFQQLVWFWTRLLSINSRKGFSKQAIKGALATTWAEKVSIDSIRVIMGVFVNSSMFSPFWAIAERSSACSDCARTLYLCYTHMHPLYPATWQQIIKSTRVCIDLQNRKWLVGRIWRCQGMASLMFGVCLTRWCPFVSAQAN